MRSGVGAVIDAAFVCALHPWLDRMVARLKASTMIATLPSAAPVLNASSASRMRQFAGYSPACEIARNALAAVKKSGNCTAPPARNLARSCNRIQA